MVISVFSHTADLKPPAEQAAVQSKELVSSAGVLHPSYSQKFMLSFSCCIVISNARNVRCGRLFCSSATKIIVTCL